MKTDDLIVKLAHQPPRRHFSPRALLVIATLVSLIVALFSSMLWLEPRTDLGILLIISNKVFVLKLLFAIGIILVSLPIVRDLSVPGRVVRWGGVVALAPFLVILALAFADFAGHKFSTAHEHSDHFSLECLWQIPALGIPAFFVLAVTLRYLGPTDLNRAGAYLGLLAGGIGAFGYALHCHHDSVLFVGVAYTAAIVEMTLLGALLGPRVLRWV